MKDKNGPYHKVRGQTKCLVSFATAYKEQRALLHIRTLDTHNNRVLEVNISREIHGINILNLSISSRDVVFLHMPYRLVTCV
jgi:hypothetical protein